MPRRTLQRWLNRWVREGRVTAAGHGRARRYRAAAPAPEVDVARSTRADRFPDFIPLAPDTRDILDYIDQPLEARKPVGYQREFLESYEPNVSFYLPEPLRRQLHAMGDTGQAGRPAGTYGR